MSPEPVQRRRWLAALVLLLFHAVALPLCFTLGMKTWGCDAGTTLCRVGAVSYLVVGSLLNLAYDLWMKRPRRYTMVTTPVFLVSAGLLLTYLCGNMGRLDSTRQSWSRQAVRKLGEAVEERRRHDPLRTISTVQDLQSWTGKELPERDGWGHLLVVSVEAAGYYVVSHGVCGEPDVEAFGDYAPGETHRWSDDIVFSDGKFLRYPAGSEP